MTAIHMEAQMRERTKYCSFQSCPPHFTVQTDGMRSSFDFAITVCGFRSLLCILHHSLDIHLSDDAMIIAMKVIITVIEIVN